MFVIVHGGESARLSGIPPAVEFTWYGLPARACAGYAEPRMSCTLTKDGEQETLGFHDVRVAEAATALRCVADEIVLLTRTSDAAITRIITDELQLRESIAVVIVI